MTLPPRACGAIYSNPDGPATFRAKIHDAAPQLKAAKELGYSPYPQPSGNLSQAYTNTYGVEMGPCTYCGFCEWFGCSNYSKSSPQACVLPALVRSEKMVGTAAS